MQLSLESLLKRESINIIQYGQYNSLGLRESLGMPPIGEFMSYSELCYFYQIFNIKSLEKMDYFARHSFKYNNAFYVYEINHIGNIYYICVKK